MEILVMLYKKVIMALIVLLFCGKAVLFCKSLHIMFVVSYFPAPSQTYILNMMTGLIDRGHSVSIFAFRKNDAHAHPDIIKYSLMDSVIYQEFPEQLPECDIVFCQNGSLGKKIADNKALSQWLSTRKLVVCLRGSDITSDVIRDPALYNTLFIQADLFLPVCDYFKKKLIALGCHPDKVIVHHSAINCSQFFFKHRKKPQKNPINLVSVCRLVKKKGIDDAIKAVALVVKKYPNIHYTIVGEGGQRAVLEKLIKQLKLTDKITLYGWATQEQVVAILDKSHIFLLPSTPSPAGMEEGIANALKEAMAMGLLSIGTWHAGTPELIDDGYSGFLVPERDSKQLAYKIEYLIQYPQIWKAMQLAARKKIEQEFETTKSVEQLEEIFYQLLN